MNEQAAAQAWLRDTLAADAELSALLVGGVFTQSVPTDARMPVVKIDRQDAVDLMEVGTHRVWADLTYLIRGIARGPDRDVADAIGDRIDEVLHRNAGGNDTTIYVHEVFREEPFIDETVEGGTLYLHVGGIYRLRVQALA